MSVDPYAPPAAEVADVLPEERRRPLLVWVITLLFGFGAVWNIIMMTLIFTGTLTMPAETRTYYAGLTVFDHAFTVANASLNIWGMVQFFRLRAVAVRIFIVVLVLSLLSTGYHFAAKGLADALVAGAAWGMASGMLIWGLIIYYAWRLRVRGILR